VNLMHLGAESSREGGGRLGGFVLLAGLLVVTAMLGALGWQVMQTVQGDATAAPTSTAEEAEAAALQERVGG